MRVAMIGASHWHFDRYIEILSDMDDIAVVGISDDDPQVVQKKMAALGCAGNTDYSELLRTVRPDFLVVTPRHDAAASVIDELLDTGLPMLVEKPMGLTAAQVKPLVEKATKHRTYVAVPFVNRCTPLWRQFAQPQSEPAGILYHVHLRIVNGPPVRYARHGCGWMLQVAHSGGGALRNLGIHMADAMIMLAGGQVEELEIVSATMRFESAGTAASTSLQKTGQDIEVYALAVIRGPGGWLGTLEAGYTFPSMAAGMTRSGDSSWRIAAEQLYAMDRDERLVLVRPNDAETIPTPTGAERYRQFVVESLARLDQGRDPIAGIQDCYRAMQLVDAIYRKAGAPWMGERTTLC